MPNVLEIRFGQISPYAKMDIRDITVQNITHWSTPDDLKLDDAETPGDYATLEHNHVVLDGTMQEFPDDTDNKTWGIFSETLSDMAGNFQEPPQIAIIFNGHHRSVGLTFYFYPFTNDYASSVYVQWYRDEYATDLITEGVYVLDGIVGILRQNVDEYQRINITFLSTNNPFRFIKLYAIEFGINRVFEDREISELSILEEIDPTSDSIHTNTMAVKIRTLNSIFSPLTSPDFDEMMMKHQMMEVYRNKEPFGIFFLEDWEDVTQDGIEFDIVAGDALSMLDRYEFLGGMYQNKLVQELFDEIFEICFPTRNITYVLDAEYANSTVTGYLPICKCGEALQQIAFALNATVDTARIGHIRIYPREQEDIKATSVVSSNGEQPWAAAANLNTHQKPSFFAGLEQNYTLLDKSLGEFPDDITGLNLGWVSESMSDENGEFEEPPIVSIRYDTTHNFRKAYLAFSQYENEYIETFEATFYDEQGDVIKTQSYTFNENPALWEDEVHGFRRIDIKVIKTSNSFRFARIAYIDYGRSFYIPRNRQYRRGRDKPTELVTTVEVTSHQFIVSNESQDIFRGYLPLGKKKIKFNQPMYDLSITAGASIVESHVNFAVVDVYNSNAEIKLFGKEYLHNKLVHSVTAEIQAGGIGDTKTYEDYTLVSPGIAQGIAQEIYKHFQNRIQSDVSCALDDLEVGYIAEVETRRRNIVGVIRSMDINLRANIAILEVVGYAATSKKDNRIGKVSVWGFETPISCKIPTDKNSLRGI